jgi:uncharacterized protein YndB with AHSA1/START domain
MGTSVIDRKPKSEPQENLKLEIKRVIKASRPRVFDAWTRPETIRRWFTPGTFRMVHAQIDARVDGVYRFEMDQVCEGNQPNAGGSVVTGRYVRVEPYDLLAFTWKNSWAVDEESLVTIELRDVDGGTEMTLTQERFLTQYSRDRHATGWESVTTKLQEFFAA